MPASVLKQSAGMMGDSTKTTVVQNKPMIKNPFAVAKPTNTLTSNAAFKPFVKHRPIFTGCQNSVHSPKTSTDSPSSQES